MSDTKPDAPSSAPSASSAVKVSCDRCGGSGEIEYTALTLWVFPSGDRMRRDQMGTMEAIGKGARLAYADVGPISARAPGRYAYSEPCGCPATRPVVGVDPLALVRRARVIVERIREWETVNGQERSER